MKANITNGMLKTLTWEELDHLEQRCRAMKKTAKGPQVYNSNGDATHRAAAQRAFVDHFDDVLYKHHGAGPSGEDW